MNSRRRRGVSNIIAGVIVITIIFTSIIPLAFYFRDTNLNYERAIENRRTFEAQKAAEDVDAAAYIDFLDNNRIKIWVENSGPIPLTIIRALVAANDSLDNPSIISLADGFLAPIDPPLTIDTGIEAEAGKLYYIYLVTERGNVFVPDNSPLFIPSLGDDAGYPYTLHVTVVNMEPRKIYTLSISGNIAGGSATRQIHITTLGDNVTESFGVNPGNYNIRLAWDGSTIEATVTVPETLYVIIYLPDTPARDASIAVFATVPRLVYRMQTFLVEAFIINVGNVPVCDGSLRVEFDTTLFEFDSGSPPQEVQVSPACLWPGESSKPVVWKLKSKTPGEEGEPGEDSAITVLFSGTSADDGSPVSGSDEHPITIIPRAKGADGGKDGKGGKNGDNDNGDNDNGDNGHD